MRASSRTAAERAVRPSFDWKSSCLSPVSEDAIGRVGQQVADYYGFK